MKLAQDLRFGSGTTPTAGEERYYGGAIPWVVTGDLRDGLLETVPGSVTPEALLEFSALRLHPAGALIVAMYGATVGRIAITALPVAVNQACCVMHSGVRLRTWFVFYYLLSHRQVLMERGVGAGQPNISQEILRSLRLVAPDLAAQDRVVSVLDGLRGRAGQLSSRIRSQLDLLAEHRQALITAAVTGELEVPGVAA
ncbi:MAG: restriction endonuclease subunit S [Acidimicrobiales bacterium]